MLQPKKGIMYLKAFVRMSKQFLYIYIYIYQELAVKSQNLSSFRLLTMCILGFYGPMCYSEISKLGKPDITFHDTFIKYLSKNAKLTHFPKET